MSAEVFGMQGPSTMVGLPGYTTWCYYSGFVMLDEGHISDNCQSLPVLFLFTTRQPGCCLAVVFSWLWRSRVCLLDELATSKHVS